ncbi:ArnT family glycosyltransferase [Rubritalea profundi]|uniref:Glycosyltransferase RgtA/B/C/D-like domain-containing protein n=1 Tax=Rubritalea profundi TaxID=1658618 RepID=A0A2S7U5Q6_9BACT|nr:hypothetical protein [Rubritalea profundi]PQJ29900.1 hypothetical protein BSZ32_16355 [Rubritalea profundi]
MNAKSAFDSGNFFRRAIFAALLIGLFILHTVFSFDGLTSRTGIDQAQVGREVARGNGLTTKFIRPITLQQMIENEKEINLLHIPETYHSPLNILVYAGVLKMVGADDFENYKMEVNDKLYKLDRIIAITCATFFLIAIGLNYLLISRIFDAKIASIVALIMVFSDYMWKITQTGLPQMLMLTLFSAACYLAWRAVEAQEAERKPLVPALLSGFFFGLLALSHWMTLWIFIGYFIFACFYFRPRGVIAIGLALIMLFFIAGPIIFYWTQTGDAKGTAFHAIHAGGADNAMRQFDGTFNVKGILARTAQSTLLQISNVHNYLGGLILAPAFFLCLAHPFKRSSIAIFRWNILIMWIFASIGMGIYGLTKSQLDPNQLHLLFAPLMCGYGIALISIIWSHCPLSQQAGFLGNLHIAVILLITAAPLILHIKQLSDNKRPSTSINGVDMYSLNGPLHKVTDNEDIIISDQPWAVAWYADRHAIWLPQSYDDFSKIEAIAEGGNPIAGLHISSMSYRGEDIQTSLYKNRDLAALAYIPWITYFTRNESASIMSKNASIAPLIDPQIGRYPHKASLSGLFEPSTYYSRTKIRVRN